MRLFIAIDVTPTVTASLTAIQKQFIGAKLTLTKSFHLTLKFLGEVAPSQADEIKKRLSHVHFKPFIAALDNTSIFPEQGAPRVVWVGIEPATLICALQKQIDEALDGLFPKEKDFKAHITLARVKETDKQLAEHVKSVKVEPLTFDVKEFKLIESQLKSTGPAYRTIASFE